MPQRSTRTGTARRRLLRITTAALAAALIATIAAGTPASSAPAGFRRACAPASGLRVTCFAEYRSASVSDAALARQRLTPADIAAAYRLPANVAGKGTVAVVDAFDDPHAEHDLAVYRARFGLPPCTTANGCFRKVNQKGKTAPLPAADPGWGVEISLDLDAVSAACPHCHILLVEGNGPSLRSLGIAENTAVRLGADVVSNSYGTDEFSGMHAFAHRYYFHPGVPVVASSGDFGFGIPAFPAVVQRVIAVGGTSLSAAPSTPRGWTEHAWYGAGSGCSGYVAKAPWQPGKHCLTRMVADVSAVADPASGFLVYDTFGLGRQNGYLEVGGTSLSAPLIAAMIARAGNPRQLSTAEYIYRHRSALYDVRGGSNGYCGGDYLCTGKRGYDGPTGMGSPRGLGAL